jgi:ABC-type sugar transport system ATPase subunit
MPKRHVSFLCTFYVSSTKRFGYNDNKKIKPRRNFNMAELRLEHIHKIYDNKVTAVKDFNLHIQDKEFIVFVGPSGCGKSTTLRMVAGLEEISQGDFYIDDKRVNDVAPKDRDIAMVFQNYALYPHMNVYDNMAFGLKLRKIPKVEIDRRVKEAARILGLEQFRPQAKSSFRWSTSACCTWSCNRS